MGEAGQAAGGPSRLGRGRIITGQRLGVTVQRLPVIGPLAPALILDAIGRECAMMLTAAAPMLEKAKAAVAAANDCDPAETIGRDQDAMFLNHPRQARAPSAGAQALTQECLK
jgi:hypothetical protein